jgi:ATP-dependent Clp protease protease subunit
MKRYYQIVSANRSADIYIYGDITSWPWFENDVSAAPLVKEIDALEVDEIHVYINSYGGEVAEALAICSALARNKAKIVTYCDGFACSAAADIFMAGDERIMSPASLLMIHHVWTWAAGNSAQLHKAADDLETISKATEALYSSKLKIAYEELKAMLDAESWIDPQQAVDKGFATSIIQTEERAVANQSARIKIMQLIQRPETQGEIALRELQAGVRTINQTIALLKPPDPTKQNKPPEPIDPPEQPKANHAKQLLLGLFK